MGHCSQTRVDGHVDCLGAHAVLAGGLPHGDADLSLPSQPRERSPFLYISTAGSASSFDALAKVEIHLIPGPVCGEHVRYAASVNDYDYGLRSHLQDSNTRCTAVVVLPRYETPVG